MCRDSKTVEDGRYVNFRDGEPNQVEVSREDFVIKSVMRWDSWTDKLQVQSRVCDGESSNTPDACWFCDDGVCAVIRKEGNDGQKTM